MNKNSIATIVNLHETMASEPLIAQAGSTVAIHGTGFGEENDMSVYNVVLEGPDCSALVPGGYSPASRQSDTLLFVTADLTDCMGQLSATLRYSAFDVTSDFVSIATFDLLRVLDTSQSQGVGPSMSGELSTVTLSGFGFGLSSSEYYSITIMDNAISSSASCALTPQNVTDRTILGSDCMPSQLGKLYLYYNLRGGYVQRIRIEQRNIFRSRSCRESRDVDRHV